MQSMVWGLLHQPELEASLIALLAFQIHPWQGTKGRDSRS
jgi:hypothetical protein